MRKYSGILFGFIAAALVLVAAFGFGSVEAKADGETHKHCFCGGNLPANSVAAAKHLENDGACDATQVWQPISTSLDLNAAMTTPLAEGETHRDVYIYLTASFSRGVNTTIPTGVHVYLCLNGQTITATSTTSRLFTVGGETRTAQLSICDCSAEKTGTIVGPKLESQETGNNQQGASVFVYYDKDSYLTLYGGTITGGQSHNGGGNICVWGGTFNLYDGTVSNGVGASSAPGGNIRIEGNACMNMYGGTVSGGEVKNSNGGNIYIKQGTLNQYAGDITGGKSTGNGGSISIYPGGSATDYSLVYNMYGGTVSGGATSGSFGGNIAAYIYDKNNSGIDIQINIQGGTISGGTASTHGGNIALYGNAGGRPQLSLGNCTISSGTAGTYGGNIGVRRADVTASNVSGQTVSTKIQNGHADTYGGNIGFAFSSVRNEATFTGTAALPILISGGVADAYGGNIGTERGDVIRFNYCKITGGSVATSSSVGAYTSSSYTNVTKGYGGNIGVCFNPTITFSDCEISGGSVTATDTGSAFGGNIGVVSGRNSTSRLNPVINLVRSTVKNGTVTTTSSTNRFGGANIAIGGFISGDLDGGGTLNLTDSTITQEISGSTRTYGAFLNSPSSVSGNVYGKGGNIYIAVNATMATNGTNTISNGYIKRLTSTNRWCAGGNLYLYGNISMASGSKLTIDNGYIPGDGGNMYVTSGKTRTFTNVTFSNGQATSGGNIIIDNNAIGVFNNCTISGGKANSHGGNLYQKATASKSTLNNTDVYNGTAGITNSSSNGGNVYLQQGEMTINGGYFYGAISSAMGSNIYTSADTKLTITDGVFLYGTVTGTSTVRNVAINGEGHVSGGYFNRDASNTSNVALYFYKDASAKSTVTGGYIERVYAYPHTDAVASDDTAMTKYIIYGTSSNGSTTINKVNAIISGGSFDSIGRSDYVVSGKKQCKTVKAEDKLYQGTVPAGTTICSMDIKVAEGYVLTTSSMIPKTGETGVAALSGAGTFAVGDTIQLTAPATGDNAYFLGWFKGNGDTYDENASAVQGGKTTITLTSGTHFTADTTYYAVYYRLNNSTYTLSVTFSSENAFTITVDGVDATYTDGMAIEKDAEVVLTYTADSESWDFYGWQNANGRTLTSGKTYTFTMLKDLELKIAEVAKTAETKLYVLMNDNGQVLQAPTAWVAGTTDLPYNPTARIGYNGKWHLDGMDNAEEGITKEDIDDYFNAENAPNYVIVKAVYTADETFAANNQYTITVKQIVLADSWTTENAADFEGNAFTEAKGTRVLIGAPETYGDAAFAYYALENGKILSYKLQVATMFGEDTIVYAVYVPAEKEIAKLPTMSLSATTIEVSGGLSTKFTATRDIPDNYALVEHGILYVAGEVGTNDIPTEEEMEYGKVKSAVSNATGLLGTVSLNIGKVPNGYFITARGYAIVQKTGGQIEIVYSDLVTVQP